jgi:hypothetical protein
LITTPLAFATASGIGTGPAPIIRSGSSGSIDESGRTVGQATPNALDVPEELIDELKDGIRSFILFYLRVFYLRSLNGEGWPALGAIHIARVLRWPDRASIQ